MSAFYATGRLLWRPASLFMILPLAFSVVVAAVELPRGPLDFVDAIRSQSAKPDVIVSLWRFATVFSGFMGVFVSSVMRELQHTAFAATLPALTRRLLLGRLVCGIFLAAGLVALAAPFSASTALGIFGWSLLCFSLGGVAFDPALSKVESRGVPAILALIAFRPSYIEEVAAASPASFAMAASAAALGVAGREFSRAVVRRRPDIPMASGLTVNSQHLRQHWRQASVKDSEWTVDLSRGNLLSWLRAGLYEGYGGQKMGQTMFALWLIGITVITGYLTDNPMMVVFFPWIFMDGRLHLQPKFLHPLNRATRARLFFASSVVESFRAIMLGVAGLAILYLLGYPLVKDADIGSASRAAAMLLALAAWAPMTHLTKLRGPLDGTMSGKRGGIQFAVNMAYVSVAMVTALSLKFLAPSQPLALAAMTALLFATHATYWVALRRHFATKDLIVAQ